MRPGKRKMRVFSKNIKRKRARRDKNLGPHRGFYIQIGNLLKSSELKIMGSIPHVTSKMGNSRYLENRNRQSKAVINLEPHE